jgi:hypothetical protein
LDVHTPCEDLSLGHRSVGTFVENDMEAELTIASSGIWLNGNSIMLFVKNVLEL